MKQNIHGHEVRCSCGAIFNIVNPCFTMVVIQETHLCIIIYYGMKHVGRIIVSEINLPYILVIHDPNYLGVQMFWGFTLYILQFIHCETSVVSKTLNQTFTDLYHKTKPSYDDLLC